jgi:Periplasmic binding protein
MRSTRAGGVDGRKIEMVTADDESTSTGDATATQDLLSKGVFLIENFIPYAFGGAPAAQKAGVPVVGGGFDGPEWGQKPNTNMFSYLGGTNGRTSNNTEYANFFKVVGATDVAGLAYGVPPSSTGSTQDLKTAAGMVGLTMGYENLSVPFGGVDVTSYVLAMKAAGINGVACSCVQSTNLALFTGLAQGGVTAKALSLSSADSSTFASATSAAAAQGAYYPTLIPPLDLNNAATNKFLANLKAADPSYTSGYLSYGLTGAYLGAGRGHQGLPGGRAESHAGLVYTEPDPGDGLQRWRAAGLAGQLQPLRHQRAGALRLLRPGRRQDLQDHQQRQADLREVIRGISPENAQKEILTRQRRDWDAGPLESTQPKP